MYFEPVIGLEVHVQLRTETKIFCNCSTRFGAAPNSQVCPICLGMPGVLPVLNQQVLEFAVRLALAMGCRINPHSVFARKNFFYPECIIPNFSFLVIFLIRHSSFMADDRLLNFLEKTIFTGLRPSVYLAPALLLLCSLILRPRSVVIPV